MVLGCLLVASLTLNIVQYCQRDESAGLTGTYCSDTGPAGGGEYFAVLEDGAYVRYKQFELLEEGRFKTEDGRLFTLESADGEAGRFLVLDGSKAFTLVGSDGQLMAFAQINEKPLFINLPDYTPANPAL